MDVGYGSAMSRRWLTLCLTVFAALLLWGCSKPKPPTITPKEGKVTSVGAAGVGLELTFDAYNPNDFAISTRSLTAQMTLDGKLKLPQATVPTGVSLPAKQTTPVSVTTTANWSDITAVASLAASKPKVPYVVQGKITVGGENLNVDVPYTLKGEMTQQQLLNAGLKSLRIPGLNLGVK